MWINGRWVLWDPSNPKLWVSILATFLKRRCCRHRVVALGRCKKIWPSVLATVLHINPSVWSGALWRIKLLWFQTWPRSPCMTVRRELWKDSMEGPNLKAERTSAFAFQCRCFCLTEIVVFWISRESSSSCRQKTGETVMYENNDFWSLIYSKITIIFHLNLLFCLSAQWFKEFYYLY